MAASYPAAVKTFREKENLAGLNYDSNNKRTLFVEDLTQIEDEVIAIEEELGAEVSGDAETLADRLNDIETRLDNSWPVGTIYINRTNNANPNTYLPGMAGTTWVAITDKVIMGRGATYTSDGGSATHTHDLTNVVAMASNPTGRLAFRRKATATYTATHEVTGTSGGSSNSQSTGIQLQGEPEYSTNIPPMIVAYIWERTA